MGELKDGCVKPARGPIVLEKESTATTEGTTQKKEVSMLAKVGQKAIDFEANAYIQGVGFQTIKLSDYTSKWIVLCFYPGDFTFV